MAATPLTIEKIISEADVRVSNAISTEKKVDWLNVINTEFFDIVKIPQAESFVTVANSSKYVLADTIRAKNIDRVFVGTTVYPSFLHEAVSPGQNFHIFKDVSGEMELYPAPSKAELAGIVRYHRMPSTSFVSTTLTAVPDAPTEYHWIYILGLAEMIAKAMDDVSKANNYGNDYRAALSVAQANYSKRG